MPVLWRSSAPGVDLLAFFVPNPNHPLAPAAVANWMASRPGGYLDQVASLSLVGLAILFAAWRLAGFRPPRFWLVITIGVRAAGARPVRPDRRRQHVIPTPWTLLRYAPVIGSARMPARFVVVVDDGIRGAPGVRARGADGALPDAAVGAAVASSACCSAAELIAAPRELYSATVPSVFDVIAADPRPVRVLELPTGVRDGLSSLGNFSAQAQFNQTFHGKGLIGGYLSRVPPSTKARYRQMPVTSALIDVSEGRKLTRGQLDRAIAGADDFLRATNLGYVVMDRARVSADLRDFATAAPGPDEDRRSRRLRALHATPLATHRASPSP